MTSETVDDHRRLALSADDAAARSRPWQVGHRLAADLTADDRSMTDAEMAVVQALEWTLDFNGSEEGEAFRPWWIDEDSSLAEFRETGLAACEAVAAAATHPTVVAHLSDLLWSLRHGQAHRHAQRAIDAYLTEPGDEEPHDRCRAVIRAHQLTLKINDRERAALAVAQACELIEASIARVDLSIAIALLEHLRNSRLGPNGEQRVSVLLQHAWESATRTDHVERLAKLQLRDASDDGSRLKISDHVVAVFRQRAASEEGFGELVALREALRVAEELGHPSHSELVHEIETLDTEGAFSAISVEQVISRSDVANFCAGVVGTDSLDQALIRFASDFLITPDVVQETVETTPVGIRHLVTNFRIGEANSTLSSTEGVTPEEDPIAAAVRREVLQNVGWRAQAGATLFLVPALHQVLASYEPWRVGDVVDILEDGLADPVVADALARAIEHFHHHRYDEAIHIAIPRIERLVRHIARGCGVPTTRRPTGRVGGIRSLSEILIDLRGQGSPLLPEPFLTAADLTLVNSESLNLRNEYMHGINNDAPAADAALVLQLGLALALLLRADTSAAEDTEPVTHTSGE